MNPLILWNGILIDGHNRYEIIQKHDLPFQTISMEFDTRDDVIIWIISTQIARRNLSALQLSHFRGLHYNTKKRALGTGSNQYSRNFADVQNEHQQNRTTAQILAEQYNVSSMTIRRDAQVSDAIMAIGEISPEAKRKILSGRGNISRHRLQELALGTEDEIKETAERIIDGTHERRQSRVSAQDESVQDHNLGTAQGGMVVGSDSGYFEQLSFEGFLDQVTDGFKVKLRNIPNSEDPVRSKTALREFIDMLEEIYREI